jgi:hypothetical protein
MEEVIGKGRSWDESGKYVPLSEICENLEN